MLEHNPYRRPAFYFKINRPTELENGRPLHWRQEAKPRLAPGRLTRGKFRQTMTTPLRYPENMITSVRLYRWAFSKDVSLTVNKNQFIYKYFRDFPDITTKRVGMILRDALNYHPHRRIRGVNCWSFHHELEVAYGTERQILSWYEDFSAITTDTEQPVKDMEELEDDLKAIRFMSAKEDRDVFYYPALSLGAPWYSSGQD